MATLSLLSPQILYRPRNFMFVSTRRSNSINFLSSLQNRTRVFLRSRSAFFDEEEGEGEGGAASSNSSSRLEGAIDLFNNREYYACHDVVESLWYSSVDPTRTFLHAILQCAVGFHHLFSQNHKGAMMELGEAISKLRKLEFDGGPFHRFEREISDVLEFIYQTQLELAACNDDLCIAMEQTERSYQLLGSFAARERIYNIEIDGNGIAYIVFHPEKSYGGADSPRRTRLPTLQANREYLNTLSL